MQMLEFESWFAIVSLLSIIILYLLCTQKYLEIEDQIEVEKRDTQKQIDSLEHDNSSFQHLLGIMCPSDQHGSKQNFVFEHWHGGLKKAVRGKM